VSVCVTGAHGHRGASRIRSLRLRGGSVISDLDPLCFPTRRLAQSTPLASWPDRPRPLRSVAPDMLLVRGHHHTVLRRFGGLLPEAAGRPRRGRTAHLGTFGSLSGRDDRLLASPPGHSALFAAPIGRPPNLFAERVHPIAWRSPVDTGHRRRALRRDKLEQGNWHGWMASARPRPKLIVVTATPPRVFEKD